MNRPSSQDDLSFYRSLSQACLELSSEQEATLVRRLRTGDRGAAEQLARGAQRHVLSLAIRYRRYGVALTDLVAEGNFGVVQALGKFEPERGVRFVTYASYWIRAQMLGCVVRSRSLVGGSDGPMRSQMFFKLRRERARVFAQLGEGEAARLELARRLGVSSERLGWLLQRLESRDVSVHDTEERGPLHQMAGDDDQERLLQSRRSANKLSGLMRQALERLDPRERRIVEERSMAERDEERSLTELARSLGVSRERARQLEARALAKLRRAVMESDADFVRDFLGAA